MYNTNRYDRVSQFFLNEHGCEIKLFLQMWTWVKNTLNNKDIIVLLKQIQTNSKIFLKAAFVLEVSSEETA